MHQNSDNDFVSILLPCYNHEKYLDYCIMSILAQTYENIEVIIADDHSSDNSYKKLLSWENKLNERFSRVLIYQNGTNLGLPANINRMLQKANGRYIKLLATDDMLTEDAIEMFVDFAKVNSSDVICSNVGIIKETQTFPLHNKDSIQICYTEAPPVEGAITARLCKGCFISAPGTFIPKKTFDIYGMYDESYIFEDWEFWLRISLNGKFSYLDKVTALYRTGHGSLSHYDCTSKEGRIKNHRYFEDKLKILVKYIDHCTPIQQSEILNQKLLEAIHSSDKSLVLKVYRVCCNKKVVIQPLNTVKLFLVWINLYSVLKKIRDILKH